MKYNFYLNGVIKNALQSVFLIFFMAGTLAAVGYLIAGVTGIFWAAGAGVLFMVFGRRIPPRIALRMYNARLLNPGEVPDLYEVLAGISQKAGLARVPELYYIPTLVMNAFTVGSRDNAAIAVTDGIVRNLDWDELTAILAHEVSHVRHNDLWIMGMADNLSRFTGLLSNAGIIMLAVYLPVMWISGGFVPFPVILILLFAPTLSLLLQLAMSRTREYNADLSAVRLTCDPRSLARALGKVEEYQVKPWDVLFMPGRKIPAPSVLRTHPHTAKRVRKLMAMEAEVAVMAAKGAVPSFCAGYGSPLPERLARVTRKPGWRITGLWH